MSLKKKKFGTGLKKRKLRFYVCFTIFQRNSSILILVGELFNEEKNYYLHIHHECISPPFLQKRKTNFFSSLGN